MKKFLSILGIAELILGVVTFFAVKDSLIALTENGLQCACVVATYFLTVAGVGFALLFNGATSRKFKYQSATNNGGVSARFAIDDRVICLNKRILRKNGLKDNRGVINAVFGYKSQAEVIFFTTKGNVKLVLPFKYLQKM